MTVPSHLHINGRGADQNFEDGEKLYRGFEYAEFDPVESTIAIEYIKFPDLSCNRSKYSSPEDIRFRRNGRTTDGCYSFTVADSKYKGWVSPVHDPIDDELFPNYAHTELRVRRETDGDGELPPKGRKIKSPAKKLEYRNHLSNVLRIEFMATPLES